MADFDIASIIPFIGFFIAIVMPFLMKKMDWGKASSDRTQQEMDKLEERLRQAELKIVKMERNNHQK